MARNHHDRASSGAILHSLLARRAACTHCGSRNFRRSDRSTSSFTRLLRLRLYRCEYCWRLFALRQAHAGGTGGPRGLVKG